MSPAHETATEETMMAITRSWRYLITPLVFAGMLGVSFAAELNPAAVIYKLPDQIPWWVGSGPKFDPANTTPMPAGSFVTHFGKQVHWDGAKDEDAVLLIMGEGPATSTAAEEK
jgi:hypothetical protein